MARRKSNVRKIKRRRARRNHILQEQLVDKLKKNSPDREIAFKPTDGAERMSEVLERFVEPYREDDETEDTYRKLLNIGAVAWNLASTPFEKRERILDNIFMDMNEEAKDANRKIVNILMDRKKRLFFHDKRIIVGVDVKVYGNEWHLSVVSRPADGMKSE